MKAEESDGARTRPIQESYRPGKEFIEGLHRPGDSQRCLLGSFKGQRLGGQLPQHDMKKGDDGEGDGESDGVQYRFGDTASERDFEQVRDDRFSEPAQSQRGQRNAELRGRDIGVEIVYQTEQTFSSPVACISESCDTRAAHSDKGELGGDKKPVGKDEKENEKDIEGCQHSL